MADMKKSILLVDDEPAIRQSLRLSLQLLGYNITTIEEPLKALEMLKKGHPQYDLLLTDNCMPKMTGVELAEALSSLGTDLPIILMSGFIEPEVEARAKAAGVRQVLHKPVSISTLSAIIKCELC